MTAIVIHRHLMGTVSCALCGFHEESTADPTSPTLASILADAAMHVVTTEHVVSEHIEDDRMVYPHGATTNDPIPAAEG